MADSSRSPPPFSTPNPQARSRWFQQRTRPNRNYALVSERLAAGVLLGAHLAEPVFPPNEVMQLASLQDGMGSDRARSAADAAGYDHTEGETHVRNGLGYHARHHLLGSAGRLRGSQLPQRPLCPWPHWLYLSSPMDHWGDFAQQIRTPLTRSRTTRLDCLSGLQRRAAQCGTHVG